MAANPAKTGNSPQSSHPIVFLVLYLPFGIFPGYLTVTLAYLFSKNGVPVAEIAGLAAVNLLPQVLKVIWAPIVDATLSLKKWYVIATFIVAGCLLATGIVPTHSTGLQFLTWMTVISSIGRTLVSASAGSLAAHDTTGNMKGRVGGYIQAGNLGGMGIGGGVGLWLAKHTDFVWVPAATLSLVCILCCLGLFMLKEPVSVIRVKNIGKTLDNVLKDIWLTIKTKTGLLALILSLVPIGTGAAGNLFAAIAKDWRAGADLVALVTGITGGIVTIAGSFLGGWLCDLMDRKGAYILFGLLQAASLLGMAFCPHTPVMYAIWTLLYTFIFGIVAAAYVAFVLEAIGGGAAASKYELYLSAGYLPTYLMVIVGGMAYTRWGGNGILETEAVLSVVAALLFFGARAIINRTKIKESAQG